MASASTTGDSGKQFPIDDTISNPTIDNDFYIYRLETCIAGGTGCRPPNLRRKDRHYFLFADDFESGNTDAWSTTVP